MDKVIERIAKIDKGILVTSLLMMSFGIVFVYSSSFVIAQQKYGGADYFLAKHLVRVILALVSIFVFMNIDYHIIVRSSRVSYIFAILLLIYVITLSENDAVNGAKRWIDLGFFKFQVSEFARIVLIITLAEQLEKAGDKIREKGVFIKLLVKICIISGLIFLEPDLSTALIIGVVGLCLLFVGGARILHISAIALPLIPIVIFVSIATPYRYRRLLGYFDMAGTKDSLGYQAYQALIGLGNGGVFGVGLGLGEQKSFYLPEPHTDFIFSILGEEVGFIGLVLILMLFAFILYRGVRIAFRAPDKQGQIIAVGLTLVLAMYVIVHTFVNTGLMPTTGVPLPFLSYGGMSLVFTMISMGILLNISSQAVDTVRPQKKRRKR